MHFLVMAGKIRWSCDFDFTFCTSLTCLLWYVSSGVWFQKESSSSSSDRYTNNELPQETPKIFTKYQRNMQDNDND